MESEEITYQKVYVSPRPPPNISYTDNWMIDLSSEVALEAAKKPNESNQNRKPKYQERGDP